MELLLNDLSIHGQFDNPTAFGEALERIFKMKSIAENFDWKLCFHQNVYICNATPELGIIQAIMQLPSAKRTALLNWIRNHPTDKRLPGSDDSLHLQCNTKNVKDSAVGVAAYYTNDGIDLRLVSLTPSPWANTPIKVTMVNNTATHLDLEVKNYWDPSELEAALQDAEPPIMSWSRLDAVSRTKFQCLQFSRDSFRHLDGLPFADCSANRIISRLHVLDRLVGAVDEAGQRTPEGHQLYQAHFTGAKAAFSDSSVTEKREFEGKLTFPHPEVRGETLFATGHGKVNHHHFPIRIHFDPWPPRSGEAIYVVYVGPKITT